MSYVCSIHEQYVPDGKRCPYCVFPEAQTDGTSAGRGAAIAASILNDLYGSAVIRSMNAAWVKLASEGES